MSAARFGLRISNLNFSPFVLKRIKLVHITYILLISASKYIELALICSGCVSPSCRRSTLGDINPSNKNSWLCIFRSVQKWSQIEYMHFIEMCIFTVAPAKAHYRGIIDWVNSMKPLCCIEILKFEFRLIPYFCLQIKSPKIFLIRGSFSANSDHVLLMQTWSMISTRSRNRR